MTAHLKSGQPEVIRRLVHVGDLDPHLARDLEEVGAVVLARDLRGHGNMML